jgi:uncharacterized protein YaaN involved in tellurite resistance
VPEMTLKTHINSIDEDDDELMNHKILDKILKRSKKSAPGIDGITFIV